MPLSLLEAMATRVSMVVSDVAGNADLIRDGENGLTFHAGDIDGLAAQVKRLAESPELRRRLALNAWRDAQEYSWERTAAGTLQALQRAVAQHRKKQLVVAA